MSEGALEPRRSPPDWVEGQRARLLELLQGYAYEEREVTLASGQKSRFYIDCRQVALMGEGHFLIGRLLLERLARVEAETGRAHGACGGMSVGADPLCSALSLTAFLGGRSLPAIYVRKEPKGHGTGAFLEGTKAIPEGTRVALLEDVVTTAGSSLKAAERLRAHGYVVTDVFALVDREAGGREALKREGLTLHPLFTRSEDFPGGEGS